MADVKVCDRCKKQLKPCSGMRSIITGVKFSYFKFLDDTEYGYKHRDLCHECMMDYEAFMDGCEIIRKGD